jgi:prepilin-type processing-associated H-X9-DG protein
MKAPTVLTPMLFVVSFGALCIALQALAGKGTRTPVEINSGYVAVVITLVTFFWAVSLTPEVRQMKTMWQGLGIGAMIGLCGAVMVPIFDGARAAAKRASCMSNLRELSSAMAVYEDDNSDHFVPVGADWQNLLRGLPKDMKCDLSSSPWPYALNGGIGGVSVMAIKEPENTVVFFECEGLRRSPVANSALLSMRHNGGTASFMGFADGHVRQVRTTTSSNLRWKP